MLNNGITLTQNQYKAAMLAHVALGDILQQASPEDDTPLRITVGEVLEVVGKQLMRQLSE